MQLDNHRPLISFCLFAYNHEKYIREAVRGAFSQTYSPLEIVLSDDCSQDRSFTIMQEEATNYRGPHQIVLNRNERNLGMIGHINGIMRLAKGKLIVGAAGDDISFPERTEKLADIWAKYQFSYISIYSNLIRIDVRGNKVGLFLDKPPPPKSFSLISQISGHRVVGASHAWSKELFDIFGPLKEGIIREDVVIPIRAALLGTVVYIPEPLVLYRHHDKNIWRTREDINNSKDLHKYLRFLSYGDVASYKNMQHDLDVALKIKPNLENEIKIARQKASYALRLAEYENDLWKHKTAGRIRLIFKACREHIPCKKNIGWILVIFFPRIYLFLTSKKWGRSWRVGDAV
jgi:glycosyltransferase involved in cell wall biosynthesis